MRILCFLLAGKKWLTQLHIYLILWRPVFWVVFFNCSIWVVFYHADCNPPPPPAPSTINWLFFPLWSLFLSLLSAISWMAPPCVFTEWRMWFGLLKETFCTKKGRSISGQNLLARCPTHVLELWVHTQTSVLMFAFIYRATQWNSFLQQGYIIRTKMILLKEHAQLLHMLPACWWDVWNIHWEMLGLANVGGDKDTHFKFIHFSLNVRVSFSLMTVWFSLLPAVLFKTFLMTN